MTIGADGVRSLVARQVDAPVSARSHAASGFIYGYVDGWALVGDAGYSKDLQTAHGMVDALRDAELLARALQGHTQVRDELSLFEASEIIARFDWTYEDPAAQHRAMSTAMKNEVAHLTALDVPVAGGVNRHPDRGSRRNPMQERLHTDHLGTVLGVWAHPDDEVFLSAGLMGRITDRGGHVACATATRGERGTSDPTTWPLDRLGHRRAIELRASLAAVGVTDHRFLGYVDGTLPDVPDREGTDRVAAVLDDVMPDTVVTFGPEGMTGHGDHIAVSRWTTAAVRAADRRILVLYATTTEWFCRRWAPVNQRLEAFGDGLPLATPTDEIALELSLQGDELDRKLVALAAQSSQIGPLIGILGEDLFRDWWATETFTTTVHPGRAVVDGYPTAPVAITT